MTRKIYCYVDETGQDTQGKFFIVGMVIAMGEDQEEMINACEAIESRTGKGRVKWTKTRKDRRWAYVEEILRTPVFRGRLFVVRYENTRDYLAATVDAIARALEIVRLALSEPPRVIVLIDALPRKHTRKVRRGLLLHGHRIKKVRGVRREEGDALIRLADATCGFARAVYRGEKEALHLWKRAAEQGYIREIGP